MCSGDSTNPCSFVYSVVLTACSFVDSVFLIKQNNENVNNHISNQSSISIDHFQRM